MDTEEHIEIKRAIREGRPETDEGPYYHGSWWESYKGSVKGKLGGIIIGALVGAIAGVAGAALLSLTAVGTVAFFPIVAGFSAAGMLYGAHEFGDIGKVVGAEAATAEKLEQRMKSFENGKFSEIKKEIGELKYALLGKMPPAEMLGSRISGPANGGDDVYPTQHHDNRHQSQKKHWVFWNITAIGTLVGVIAGALLAVSGLDSAIFEHLGSAGKALESSTHFATVAATGLFGASFGINRDLFRQVFDKSDHLFKGLLHRGHEKSPTLAKETELATPAINTIVYDASAEELVTDTRHQDYVMSRAKQALFSLDHTKARPN